MIDSSVFSPYIEGHLFRHQQSPRQPLLWRPIGGTHVFIPDLPDINAFENMPGNVGGGDRAEKITQHNDYPGHSATIFSKCRERDSNPQGFLRRILSPLRLPFRHPGVSGVIVGLEGRRVKHCENIPFYAAKTLFSFHFKTCKWIRA